MKKVLSLILCLAMVLSVCAVSVFADSDVLTWEDNQVQGDDGNWTFDNAYGYTFDVDYVDGKIVGEDVTIVTTADAYAACNPNWAITVHLAPAGDLYEVVKVIVTPGAGATLALANGEIALVVHSSASNGDGDNAQYHNWQSKVAAMALKAGDKVKVADDKSSAYVLIPGVDDKEDVTGPVITETVILSTGKTYTTTAPNRGEGNSFNDDGVRLTNGVKGLEDAGSAESAGWNNLDKTTANVVEIIVNLGESVLSNSYVVYLAGGNWGIGVPSYNEETGENGTSVEIFASDSADGEFTAVASAADTEMVLKSGTGKVDGSWSTYTLTANAATPVKAQYIKFVITAAPVGNAFIWMDEVEVIANKTASAPSSPTMETITVDGDLSDNGWAADKWTAVSGENGSWQYPTLKEVSEGAEIPTFSYKYQFRADDTKLYGALVLDGVHEEVDGEAKNIKVRIWFRDNDEATVYSSFYDFVLAPDGTLTTAAKYNTSTTENKGANIENTTLNAVAKVVDGKTVYEFSVDVDEVTADGSFDYFVCLERKQGVNTGTLYYPAIPELSETAPHGNHPWMLWYAENDATVNVADIALGEIVVSDKEEADTSLMGTAPADPAYKTTLSVENGWEAGKDLQVKVTIEALKDVNLAQVIFNLFYDANEVTPVLPAEEDLGTLVTAGADSWKDSSIFYLGETDEEGYGLLIGAPGTTNKDDALNAGDKIEITLTFKVLDTASGLINFQLSNDELLGYTYETPEVADVAGEGASLAVEAAVQTGDAGIFVIAALALVALIGTAVVIKKRA